MAVVAHPSQSSWLARRLRGMIRRHSNLQSIIIIGAALIASIVLGAASYDSLEFQARRRAAQTVDFATAYTLLTGRTAPSITTDDIEQPAQLPAQASSVLDAEIVRAEVDNMWLFLIEADGDELATMIPPHAAELLSSLYTDARIPVSYLGMRTRPGTVASGIIFGGFVMFMMNYMMSMTGIGRQMGTLLRVEDIDTRFTDVAGADEAKRDLMEFVRMIRGEINYARLGARTPRGVLLYGPPGTGKTLLARATAGEAGVNFLAATGSDFGGMLVGQGRRDVSKLFRRARGLAPCIVFLDEIDSIGKKRGARSHDDYETTTNALLAELDGITGRDGVYFMAATNHPSSLDDALIRPGRIDRNIRVPLPDLQARRKLLDVHIGARQMLIDQSIDRDVLARKTAGLSGAELENLVNEAGIQAGRDQAETVMFEHFDRALLKISFGEGASNIPLSEHERALVAYHEAGHAVLALHEPTADPILRATIEPRGETLGHVHTVPDTEIRVMPRSHLEAKMRVIAAGRAAEIIAFGPDHCSSLAGADIKMISRIALEMTHHLGMSKEVGFFMEPMETPLSRHSHEVLKEARAIANQALDDAIEILTARRDDVDKIAAALLEKETLTGDEVRALVPKAEQPPFVMPKAIAAE